MSERRSRTPRRRSRAKPTTSTSRPRRARVGPSGSTVGHPAHRAVGQRQGHDQGRSASGCASARRPTTISSSPTTPSRATTASSSRDREGVRVRDLGSTNGTASTARASPTPSCSRARCSRSARSRSPLRPVACATSRCCRATRRWFGAAIGQSLAMRTIFGVLERIAPTEATVLLEGETGTGKDVLARAIWTESSRAQRAVRRRRLRRRQLLAHRERALRPRARRVHRRRRVAPGRVRARPTAARCSSTRSASCPLDVQPKLLRVLETREFRRVGGNQHA